MILDRNFYNRKTLIVAKDLLGKVLVRKFKDAVLRDSITEVEVYDGFHDLASHAARGKTPRNKIMFGPAGHWYVYLVYGMHWMLNVVTREEDYPAAILIRGTSTISGPARLTKFFKIDKAINGLLAESSNGLWIENGDGIAGVSKIKKSPRIGVAYAGPIWSKKQWRFFI